MNRALTRLAFTRSFPRAWTLCVLVLTVLLASMDETGDTNSASTGTAALQALGLDTEHVRRSLARQELWTALLLLWMPGLLVLAAGTVPHWRRGEVAWLAPAALGRGRILISTWLGIALAGALVLLTCAVAAEVRAGEGPPGRRLSEDAHTPRVILLEGDDARTWEVTPPAGARVLRVPLVAVIGGALPTVRLSATRAGGTPLAIERAVPGHITCELPLPAGSGPLEVRLERLGPGAGVALLGAAVFTSPVASERLASVGLFARAWLALCAWSALALGLGAWFSGATATLGTLAVAVATWMSDATPAWVPGRDLGRALEAVGEGFVPAALGAPELAAAVGCVLCGLWVGHAGLGTWRRA